MSYLYSGRTFRIRETREEDIPTWYAWFNDPEITKELTHGVIPNTIERQREFRLAHIHGQNRVIFSIVAPDSQELIGTCSINYNLALWHGHAEISLVLGNKKFHKGPIYMEITTWQLDHAFFKMNMHSIYSATSSENQVVIATLQRMGFKKVGALRDCGYIDGQYRDAILHDILKDEWTAIRKRK